MNFLEKLIKKGVSDTRSLEANQHIAITNTVSLVIALLYLFYAFYGVYIDGSRTILISLTFMVFCTLAYTLNAYGRMGAAKMLLMGITSFSVLFTYHVYTIGDSILTAYFPILLGYVFFFDFSEERKHFLISISLTLLTILLCFLFPRHQLYQIIVPVSLVELSDKIHVLVSLSITGTLLIVVIRNKDQVHRNLISEKQKLEHALVELKEMQSQLINAEKMASLGQMSAGINHEIKNPLNFIKASLDNMKQNADDELIKKNEPFIEIIEEGLQRLNRIVNSLSHFSHQSDDHNQECNIHHLIENCLNILEHKSKGRITIEKVYCTQKHVIGNSGRLHQVFLNLLGNAMHAIPKRGQIKISIQTDENFMHVVIDDSGTGITSEVLDKIFDPFFTTKKAGEGTGLGLAISSKIVSDHAGSIVATSYPGKGSTFRVSLPVLIQSAN